MMQLLTSPTQVSARMHVCRKASKMKRTAALVTATAVLTLGTGLTTPAFASTAAITTVRYGSTEAQLDNNPGNGAASWIWVWNPVKPAAVDYEDYNGNVHRLYVDAGHAATTQPPVDIWRIRACQYETNGIGYYFCGNWS
ncbi:hypothetical protein [Streptomyces sp. T12]|uniref:hypothetical protein n=1 Tax=Streptomyces sp. T12 TaxID=477697 RepID=UPI00164527DD|nr:hypothetical protein [Streptomyces sp. T12]